MVSIREERGVVAEMYDNEEWRKKVDKMSDTQVHAIYLRLMAEKNK